MGYGERKDKSGRPFPWAERTPKPENIVYVNNPDQSPQGSYFRGQSPVSRRSAFVPTVQRQTDESENIEDHPYIRTGTRTSFVPNPSKPRNYVPRAEPQEKYTPRIAPREVYVPQQRADLHRGANESPEAARIWNNTFGASPLFPTDESRRSRRSSPIRVVPEIRPNRPATPEPNRVHFAQQDWAINRRVYCESPTRPRGESPHDEHRLYDDDHEEQNENEKAATILAFVMVLVILALFSFMA